MTRDFGDLFETFTATATRFEALPSYDVADYEGARLAAFLAGKPLPVRSVTTDPWLAQIAATATAGKAWSRVRVLDEPLTDYERFELAVYPESQAVGENIRIVSRRDLPSEGPDFWLFDVGLPTARVAVMRYDEVGRWLGVEVVEDGAELAEAARYLDELLQRSVSLNEFLAVTHA